MVVLTTELMTKCTSKLLSFPPYWAQKLGARDGTRTRKAYASVWKTELLPLETLSQNYTKSLFHFSSNSIEQVTRLLI